MLHGGKTFRTHDPRCYAAIRSTAGGGQEVVVVINGKTHRPALDRRGRPIFPKSAHVPHNLTIQARRALACKITVDKHAPPC